MLRWVLVVGFVGTRLFLLASSLTEGRVTAERGLIGDLRKGWILGPRQVAIGPVGRRESQNFWVNEVNIMLMGRRMFSFALERPSPVKR